MDFNDSVEGYVAEPAREFNLRLSNWFWPLIAEARQDPARMRTLLARMTTKEIHNFYRDYEEAAHELYPGHSIPERGFDEEEVYVASCWVVAQGREKYLQVWENPELLPHPNEIDCLLYGGIAASLWEERTGEELL
jgi:hypothetical protein